MANRLFRRLKILTILPVLIILIYVLCFHCIEDTYAAEPFGTYLGEFNDVWVFSNGSDNYYSGEPNDIDGTYTGIKWQCVEYVRRYYLLKFGVDLASKYSGEHANANTWYDNADKMELDGHPNGGQSIALMATLR